MDPLSILTLIGIIGTVVGGILTNRSNRSNVASTNQTNQQIAQETNQAQALLAQQQHSWNVSDWQTQAAYDAPFAQMQRFRDAGLNPALIYGQMSSGPSINSTSQPTMQMANMQSFLAQNPLDNLDPLSLAQLHNIEANTRYVNAQAETEDFMRQARFDNLQAATSNLYQQNEDLVSRIQQRVKENALTDAQINDISFDQMYKHSQNLLDWKRLENESKLTEAQVAKLDADARKALAEARITNRQFDEMCWTYMIRRAGLVNEVNLSQAKIDEAEATARKLGLDSDMIEGKAAFERDYYQNTSNSTGFSHIAGVVRYKIQAFLRDAGGVLHL